VAAAAGSLLARALFGVEGNLAATVPQPGQVGPIVAAAGGFAVPRQRASLVDLDGRKAALGDAQRECSFVIVTAPRQRPTRPSARYTGASSKTAWVWI
jgi:hypothetical protein